MALSSTGFAKVKRYRPPKMGKAVKSRIMIRAISMFKNKFRYTTLEYAVDAAYRAGYLKGKNDWT